LELLTDFKASMKSNLTDNSPTVQPLTNIMDGDLHNFGLQSVLKMLALSGKSGTLQVYSGTEKLFIYLHRGEIVELREGSTQPDILRMLYLINKLEISQAQMVYKSTQGDIYQTLSLLFEYSWMSANELQNLFEVS